MTHTPPPLHVGPPPSSLPATRIRPSRWWYLLVPLIFLAGAAAGIVSAIDEGRSVLDSFSTLGADGNGTVELDSGNEATVLALWDDGRATSTLERPAATVVISDPTGDPVRFDPALSGRTTFSYEGTSAIDLGSFEARSDGPYRVQVTFQDASGTGIAAPNAAVGRLDWASVVARVLRPMGIGLGVSFALLVTLIVLRSSSKRRARTASRSAHQSQGPISFT